MRRICKNSLSLLERLFFVLLFAKIMRNGAEKVMRTPFNLNGFMVY